MKKTLIPVLALIFVISSCGDDTNFVNEENLDKFLQESAEEYDKMEVVDDVIELDESDEDIFYSEDGRFKINFQGTPMHSSDVVPTEVGNIEMTTYMYEKSATEAYMVAYNDYPTEMIENASMDEMLDGAKNGSAGSMGITQFDLDQNTEIEGNPGRHFKGNNGSYYVEYKLFVTGIRLYQIAIIRDGSYATKARTNDFFNSFKLVED